MNLVPALLNALALLGLQYPGAWPDRSMLRQLALLAAVTIAVICAVSLVQMLIDHGRLPQPRVL